MYNLITDNKSSSSRPSAAMLDSQTRSLEETLSVWKTLESPPNLLVYPLEHQYTPRNLRLSSLKGVDCPRAFCLADSCDKLGEFYLFFAHFEELKRWPNYECDESDVIHKRYLTHVCSRQGVELSAQDVPIDRTSLLKPIDYGRGPDYRVGGEYLGNQHSDIEETYSDAVSYLKPKQPNITSMTMLTMVVRCVSLSRQIPCTPLFSTLVLLKAYMKV